MVLGAVPYICMILSFLQHEPSPYIVYPAFFLCGAGAALLWTGQGVYLGQCSVHQATSTDDRPDKISSQFNSLFFGLFQMNGGVGTLLSGVMLNLTPDTTILFIVLGSIAALGWLVVVFTPRVDPTNDPSGTSVPISLGETLRTPFHEKRILLTQPIIFFNGCSLGFLLGYLTNQVIEPAFGKSYVGYVLAAYYFCNTFFTFAGGMLTKTCVGRKGLVIAAVILHLAYFVCLFLWDDYISSKSFERRDGWLGTGVIQNLAMTDPQCQNYCKANFTCTGFNRVVNASVCNLFDDSVLVRDSRSAAYVKPEVETTWYVLIFSLAVMFAAGDSVWETQIPAVLQSAYASSPRLVAISMGNYKLWQSLGFFAQFGIQSAITASATALNSRELFQYNVLGLGGLLLFAATCLAYLECKGVTMDLFEHLGESEEETDSFLQDKY